MLDSQVLSLTRPLQQYLATWLLQYRVRADQVTIVGFVIGISALPLLALEYYRTAIIVILLNRLADGLDGTLARLTSPTDRGGFLDIVLDFLFYASIPLGFALANPEANAFAAVILMYTFIGTACSFLAFAVVAAKRQLHSTRYPNKSFYYLSGLTEATETILVFIFMCLFPQYFAIFSYSFAFLCVLTTILRIYTGWQIFQDSEEIREKQ